MTQRRSSDEDGDEDGDEDRAMMRLRAVRAMLVEDLAGMPRQEAAEDEGPEAVAERERDHLVRAQRRALLVVLLDLVAVTVLFLLRDPVAGRFLAPGATEEGVFTAGVLLVTAHAGFRLAQYLGLRAVARLHQELTEREG